MKKLLAAIMFLSIILAINAKMIDQKTAETVVENWIKQQDTKFEFSDQIVKVEAQRVSEIVLTYTMHLNGKGFVIVSADDNIEPILAFSAKTIFDEKNISPATRDYLKVYYDQIEFIITKGLINKEAQDKWASLIHNTYQNRDTDYRSYLLSTTWNQGIYYNAQCPSDTQGPDGHVYAGCVATSMSQIMKYWAHPAQGQGSHSYYWSTYGNISANFGNATYNWAAMPNNITGHNTEIAKLLFHAGVSVDMQYGPNGSGAYSSDVPIALTSYFGYNSQGVKYKSSYNDSQWTTMLKNELDNARPIYYAGSGPDGGHAFVCDGYSGTNYFHFNWGWSGSADGYFYLNALNPASYSFTSYQEAVMGIEPVEIDDPSTDIYATDLFISEYIEGSSNNKALEIFNGTGETVDLTAYKIKLATNGNTWNEGNTYQMTGTLAHGGTFVICHNQANANFKALADVYPNSGNPTNFNGNDCVGLFKNDALIDIFGIYNTGNSSEPNFNVAGVTGAAANHTLIRKPTVISPSTDWASSAGTDENNSEWIVYPIDYIDDLGQHTFNPQVPTAAVTPTFSPGSGSYYNSVSVTIECSTPEASIYYTTDGTDPNNQSMAYTTPINITQNTNLKAIAYAEGLDPSNIANANYTIIIPIANANIAALRQQDDDESTIYQLTGEAVVTFKQTYRNQKFVQDATGGILIDDQANILGNYNLYDGITGITGKLVSFGGMLQFTPVLPGNTASSTNNEVSPTTISANTFNNNFEDYEAQLVRIDDVQFTSTGNFANGQIYYAASGSDILKFRTTFYDVDYTGTAIPTGNLSIVGIANSTDDGNFISARNAADFIVVTTNPPTNVVAVASDTAVELTWDEPGTGIGTWFTHALINEFSDAIGTGSAAQFEVAHRYSPAHLASFGVAGATLSKVQFMPHEPAATYTVKIYTGGTVAGPGPLAHSQVVASVNADVWNEVTLTQTVTIPTDSELWIGIGINTPTGYPAGCDEGPAVINYGEMMYFGGSWTTLYDLADIDANWMIKGMASGATGTRTFALNMDDSKIDQRGAGAKRITGKHAFSADPMKPIVTRKNTPATKQDAFITHNTRSRSLTGYNIWRAPAASTADETTWTAIATNVSATEYTDNTWAQVATGEYKYAVKAIYTGGLPSNPAFSNSVSKNMDCNVTITLATADAASPAGAVVTLTNTDNNPAHVYTATATAATVNFPAVWHGVYTIKVVKAGYQTVIVENVIISGEEYSHPTITLPITNVVFSEGFEGTAFPPTGWTTIDSDGDGKNWIAWTYTPHSGTKSASSASYDNNSGTLTPDNWLITNQINLQTGYSYSLSFWVAPQDADYPEDHYSVMVSTTNAQPASFTSIFSETITSDNWTQKTVNLPYAGQNIYIAFRHHDCTDWYIMKLDDIEITRTPSSDTFVSVSGQVNDTSGGLQGANVELAGAQTYTATTTANGAFTMASVLGNASYTLTVSKDGYQTHTQTLAVGATNVVVPTITLVEDSGNTLYPPQDLTGEVVGSDVTLNWMEAGAPTAWITHSGQFGNNSVGTNAAANFDVAQRFTAAQLANLGVAGGQLLKVKFVPHEPAATYTVKVWTGGSATGGNYNPGTQVASKVAANITVDAWNTVILDTPVDIPTTGELWIGYNNNTPGGFPAGVDQGPAIDGYGNLLNMGGWGTLLEAAATLNYNWCIEGLATTVDRQIAKIDINSIPADDAIVPSTRSYAGMFDVTSFETANTMANRALLGYKVYRNGTLLTTNTLPTSTLSYVDTNLDDGTYTYGVTAVYDEGESDPATVTVEVNANYAITTFPWDEGFETFLPMGWLNIDADGDGNKWRAMDGADYAHSGTKAAASASYDNAVGPLTPDNWLISPKLSFPEGHVGTLKFWVAPQDPNWPTEIYSVMVSTTDTDLASFNPIFNEMILSSTWVQKTVQLPYISGNLYIAFRHHDCTDLFMMKLDDVHVETSVNTDVQPVFTTKLSKNYPNPFNPTTTIAYSVKEAAPVKLEIYNIKGQKVRTLVNDVMAAGNHTVVWNGHDDSGKNVGSGVYFYRMSTPKFSATEKMLLMK